MITTPPARRAAVALVCAGLAIAVAGCSTKITAEPEAMRACGIDSNDPGAWTGAFPETDDGVELGTSAWDAWADEMKSRATTAAGAAQTNPTWQPLADALADAATSARSIHTQVITNSEDYNDPAWALLDTSLESVDVQCGGIVDRLTTG